MSNLFREKTFFASFFGVFSGWLTYYFLYQDLVLAGIVLLFVSIAVFHRESLYIRLKSSCSRQRRLLKITYYRKRRSNSFLVKALRKGVSLTKPIQKRLKRSAGTNVDLVREKLLHWVWKIRENKEKIIRFFAYCTFIYIVLIFPLCNSYVFGNIPGYIFIWIVFFSTVSLFMKTENSDIERVNRICNGTPFEELGVEELEQVEKIYNYRMTMNFTKELNRLRSLNEGLLSFYLYCLEEYFVRGIIFPLQMIIWTVFACCVIGYCFIRVSFAIFLSFVVSTIRLAGKRDHWLVVTVSLTVFVISILILNPPFSIMLCALFSSTVGGILSKVAEYFVGRAMKRKSGILCRLAAINLNEKFKISFEANFILRIAGFIELNFWNPISRVVDTYGIMKGIHQRSDAENFDSWRFFFGKKTAIVNYYDCFEGCFHHSLISLCNTLSDRYIFTGVLEMD